MASPALARPDECVRALYESCTNSDMVGGAGRFMSGQVGLCRIMSGQGGSGRAVLLFLDFCAWLRARFHAVLVGYWAVTSLGRILPCLRIRCQRQSWFGDDSTVSVMPIDISAPGYYNTVLDTIGLRNRGSVVRSRWHLSGLVLAVPSCCPSTRVTKFHRAPLSEAPTRGVPTGSFGGVMKMAHEGGEGRHKACPYGSVSRVW